MRRKTRIFIKLGWIALLLFAVAAIAQDDSQYRIRAKIDLVVVPVTVKGQGDLRPGSLKQKDFIIYEDGRRQTISNFTNDPVPLSAAVVIDTGLAAGALTKVQESFGAMAGAFANQDEVAVYHYDKFVTKDLDFTDNLDKVETAMKKLRELKPDENFGTQPSWRGPFSQPGPVINGTSVLPPSLAPPPINAPERLVKVLHDAVFTAAADLSTRDRSRRKIILMVSDGIAGGNTHSYEDAKGILLERGIELYAVALDQPFPYSKLSVLDDYAKATGGDTYFVKSPQHLQRSYSDATAEARNQYVIGYISNNAVQGSGPVFRELKVQVAEARVKTLYRKGYFAFP